MKYKKHVGAGNGDAGGFYIPMLEARLDVFSLFQPIYALFGENQNSYHLPPVAIGFQRHCTYSGCQSAGALHGLFKTINIPARMYPCFWDRCTEFYPNVFHKGIEVYMGGNDTYIVEHADHLYQWVTIFQPSLPMAYYSFLDPHVDPLSGSIDPCRRTFPFVQGRVLFIFPVRKKILEFY